MVPTSRGLHRIAMGRTGSGNLQQHSVVIQTSQCLYSIAMGPNGSHSSFIGFIFEKFHSSLDPEE